MKNRMGLISYKLVSFFCIIGYLTFSSIHAQNINNYVFSTNQTSSLNTDLNGNVIDMSIGTTTLIAPGVTTGFGSGLITLPNNFDCWVMGTKATSISVSAHGWLGLNLALTNGNFWLGGSGLRLAPFLVNILPSTGGSNAMGTSPSGKIHYKIVGNAPNRTLVVEYLNMTINGALTNSTSNDGTFQARIYEATGVIEYVYGQINVSGSTNLNANVGFSSSSTSYIGVDIVNQTSTTTANSNMALLPGAVSQLSGGGTSTTRRAYLFTPTPVAAPSQITFSSVTQNTVTINWVNNAVTPNLPQSLELLYSNNGIDWITAPTISPTLTTHQLFGLNPSTNYLVRINAIRESRSAALVGNFTTSNSVLAKSTTTGGSWKSPSTWINGSVPSINDSVIISDGATVVIDSNVLCYKLTIGEGSSGKLIFDSLIARTLSVWESIKVNEGAIFSAGGGTTNHTLNLGNSFSSLASGSLINNGIFDMHTTATVSANFMGRLNGNISGTGTTTNFNTIHINKGNSAINKPSLDIGIPFTVQGANTVALIFSHTAGIVKITGSHTQSNPMYRAVSYSIPLNGGFELNNPNFIVTSNNGNVVCNGLLSIKQGIFNACQTSSQTFTFGTGAEFNVEGGVINAAGSLSSSLAMTFNFSSGEINVATAGNSQNGTPSFGFTNQAAIINWTGGTLNILQRATGSPSFDYSMGPFLYSTLATSGGRVNIGHASTNSSLPFRMLGDVPLLTIDTNGIKKSVGLDGITNCYNKIIVPQGASLNLSGRTLNFYGDSILATGKIVGNTSGSELCFRGQAAQYYTGTSTDTFMHIKNRNSIGGVHFSKNIVAYLVSFISPTTLINSQFITLGNGLNQTVSIQFGDVDYTGNTAGFDVPPVFNLGTGLYNLNYLNQSNALQIGNEIPPSRNINNLVLNNTNGLILTGGVLNINGTLTLTNGKLITTDSSYIHLQNTLSSAVNAGSASSYIVGPFVRRLPVSLTGNLTYNFPIGQGSYKLIALVNPKTKSTGAVDIKMVYIDSMVAGSVDTSSLTQLNQGYYKINFISGASNIDSTQLSLTGNSLMPTFRVGYAATRNGVYKAVSNAPVLNTIITKYLVADSAIQGYFVMAESIIPLNGLYLIGASKVAPNYVNLSSFFNSLNGKQIQGNVSLLLDSDYVSSSESFPIVMPRFYSNNPNWTITVKPNTGVIATIHGNNNGAIIKINGARNYVIDGSNNGTDSRNLDIRNLSVTSGNAAIWLAGIDANSTASNNIIKNTIISCEQNQTNASTESYGIAISGGTSINSLGIKNDSNQIINNEIKRVSFGILCRGSNFPNHSNNNVISKNVIGPETFGSDQISRAGIFIANQENLVIENNEIRQIGVLASQSANVAVRVGIYAGASNFPDLSTITTYLKKCTIRSNKIYNVIDEKSTSAIGINLNSVNGTNATGNIVVNNLLYNIKSNTGSGNINAGILLGSGNKDSLIFNTINLEGDLDPVGTINAVTSSFGIRLGLGISNPVIRNNLVSVNLSSGNSALNNYVISTDVTAYNWGTGSCNNNLFYFPTNNPNMTFGYVGANLYNSLSNWRLATGQDSASLASNPMLNSLDVTTPYLTSPAKGAGFYLTQYQTDILGNARNNTPTIGAYENLTDREPPLISFGVLPNDTSLLNRNLPLLAQISDTSGVQITFGLRPRIYYKKISEANVFGLNDSTVSGWKWVESTDSISPFGFVINYSLLNTPIAFNDTIQYFLVAQDTLPTPNVGSIPINSFVASSVNNIISAPSTLLSYKVAGAPMSGNYYVGAGKHFNTITEALLACYDRTIVGPVTLTLTDSIYSKNTGEIFPIEARKVPGASVINNITLRPDSGVTAIIRDSINNPLVNLNGINYFNIDGKQAITNVPKKLMIINKHIGSVANAVRFEKDACNNTIESAIMLGSTIGTAGNAGVLFFSAAVSTGNDNNTISNCEIGNASNTFLPTTLILSNGSLASSSLYNDSNTITNCYLYNYGHTSAEANAIKMSAGNNSWTITGNHIYQTATRTFTAQHYVFQLQNGSIKNALNNMKVVGNFIGGSAPFCAGAPWTLGLSNGRLTSQFNLGNQVQSEFKHNKINNFFFQSNATTSPFWGVLNFNGGHLNIDSNTIGSTTGRDSLILLGGTSATTTLFTLNTTDTGTFSFSGNTFGAIKIGGSSTNTANLTLLSILSTNTNIKYLITGNTFGNSLDSNILSLPTSAASSTLIRAIDKSAACKTKIENNIIRNLLNNHVVSSGTIHAIRLTGGTDSVVNNKIYNLHNRANNQVNAVLNASIIGIYSNNSAAQGHYIADNRIYGLAATSTASSTNTATGILISNGSNCLAERNFIHGLTTAASGNTCSINGILFSGGSTNRLVNNVICLGTDTNGNALTTTPAIYGIHRAGSSGNLAAFYNTVYIGGNFNVFSPGNSAAYYRTYAGNDSLFNNILVNVRYNLTQPLLYNQYALDLNVGNTNFKSDNNLLYVDGINGFGSQLTRLGIANYNTLTTFRNASNTNFNSINTAVNFIAPIAKSDSIDMHINSNLPTSIEKAGIDIAGITTDYDKEARNNLSPTDIGADAGNFIVLDATPPLITYNNLERDTVSSQRQINGAIIITDNYSGIDTSSNKPRIYYKKKTDNNAFLGNTSAINGWKYVTASNQISPFNFVINYALLTGGGVMVGDTIQYFVVAQDSLANLASNPVLGFEGTSVINIITAPTTPSFYAIMDNPLRGTYLVGSAQTNPNFTSLTQAVNAINLRGLASNVVFELTDTLYTTPSETFPIKIKEIYGANNQRGLTIKPSAGNNATITGSSTTSIINLDAADYITLDGSNNGTTSRNLSIINTYTNTGFFNSVVWGSTGNAANPATFNILKNLKVTGGTQTATVAGIGFGGTIITSTSTGQLNNNNTINNCVISNARYGIYFGGFTSAVMDQNNVITDNEITSLPPNNVGNVGIMVGCQNNMLISGNKIANIITTAANNAIGISLGYLSNGTFNPTGAPVTNSVIKNNSISAINAQNNYSAFGICLVPTTTGIDSIYNNLIADIKANSTGNNFLSGIYLGGGVGSITRAYHNTVYLSGSTTSTLPNRYGIAIGLNDPVVDLKNNIITNTQTTTGTGRNYAIGFASSTFSNLTCDYNAYFVNGPNGKLSVTGGIGVAGTGTEQTDIDQLRTATAQNMNALVKQINFVSTTDAHLTGASAGDTSLRCLLIPGIEKDIDYELRNTTYTYMGADEVLSNPLPVSLTQFNAVAEQLSAKLIWLTAHELNNKGFVIERSLNGVDFTEINFVKGKGNTNGATQYEFVDAAIFTKTTTAYYRLKQIDFNGAFEYSKVIKVSKLLPTVYETLVYPNPTSGSIQIKMQVDVPTLLEIGITDMNGKWYATKMDWLTPDKNTLTITETSQLLPGVYFVKITHNKQTQMVKLVKVN